MSTDARARAGGRHREHLGADEHDQPDEQTRGHDTRVPLLRHDRIGFRCHCQCLFFLLPRCVLPRLGWQQRPVQDFITSPGSTRWPRRKSAADSGFLPGSWSDQQADGGSSGGHDQGVGVGFDDGAGRAWSGLSTGRVWWMIKRRGPFEDGSLETQVVEQRGHGCMARTRL